MAVMSITRTELKSFPINVGVGLRELFGIFPKEKEKEKGNAIDHDS